MSKARTAPPSRKRLRRQTAASTETKAIAALQALLDLPSDVAPDSSAVSQLTALAARTLEKFAAATPPLSSPPPIERAARLYFDYALTGIVETDQHGRIWRANPAAASITGLDVRILCGRLLGSLASPSSVERADRHFVLLREQGITQAEWTMIRRDGREIIVSVASIQVDEGHFVHVFDDVTDQRNAMEAIERARAAADAANRAKSDFVTTVSHEIRTPLNAIIGLGQLVLQTDVTTQQRDYLALILRSGKTLLRLVNDLLDTAKLESGRMEYEVLPYPIDALLSELDDLRTPSGVDHPAEVRFHVSPDVPSHLMGDRMRLGQCLRNLLGNAIKFTPAGRIDLHIDVAAGDGGATLVCCVADTGIGIAPEAIPRLFSPFSQADSSTTRRYGGTGLGLHIARELARGMGGDLQVESAIGQGSRFTLTLPLRIADPDSVAQHDDRRVDVPQEFRGRTILVADDDPTNRVVVTEWLSRAGIGTLVAENGHEVLECIAKSDGGLPELIFMDVQMPDMDGLDATRELRTRGCTLPIIGLSAGASRTEQAACLAAGMNDFIPKPIDLDELWGCLTRWLSPSPTQSVHGVESVEDRFLDDATALARARAAFRASHGDDAARLLALLAAGDVASAARVAHSLRGSAATLGLDDVAARAHTLEISLKDAAPARDCEELCHDIGRVLALALATFEPK